MKHPAADLESVVFAFESAYASSGVPRIVDFTPPHTHPDYAEVVVELIRVDLERRHERGLSPGLEEYQLEFPDVLSRPDRLHDVAFEDYRLRQLAGDGVSREEYAARYGIDTSSWSTTRPPETAADDTRRFSTVRSLDPWITEAQRVADAARELPAVGTEFAEFELVEVLGEGSFGRVFLARQPGLAARPVVLKVSARLARESQHLANLQHSNIVPIYSFHGQDELQAVCMPFLGRHTLGSVLRTLRKQRAIPTTAQEFVHVLQGSGNERTPSADPGVAAARDRLANGTYVGLCLQLAAQLAEGLAHAHQRGIIHCDLKPDNVLICDDGRPMLLDFNLSDDVVSGGRAALMVGGTLPYMAPEHLQAVESGERLSATSDIYSLGVLLFEALTLQTPFRPRTGPVLLALQRMIDDRRAGPPAVRTLNPHVPVAVESIVQKCLRAEPAARYASAEHLRDDLRRQLADRPLRHAPNVSRRERVEKWCRRHPRLSSGTSVLAACSIVVILLFALWMVRGHQLRQIKAQQKLAAFEAAMSQLRVPLSTPDIDLAMLQSGIATAEGELQSYRVGQQDWRQHRDVRLLDAAQQARLEQHLEELFYLIARGQARVGLTTQQPTARQEWFSRALATNQLAENEIAAGDPTRAILVQRRELLELLGKRPAADELAARVADAPARVTASRFLQGVILLHTGQFAAADEWFTAMRGEAPLDVSVWFGLAQAQLGLQDYSAADVCLSTCVSLAPTSYMSYFFRGLGRLERGHYREAEADFERVLKLRPGLPAALVNRALARSAQGQLVRAERDLTDALSNGATETRVYFLRSRLRSQLGDELGAEQDRQQGLRLQPTDEKSWLARGIARLADDPEGALRDFETAYALHPGSRAAAQNIVHTLSEPLARLDPAIKLLDELLTRYPADPELLAGRGVLLARVGQRDRALRDADAVLAEQPTAKQRYQVGCIYALVADGDERLAATAIDFVQQSVRSELKWYRVAQTDPDLVSLQGHADFQRILEAAAAVDRPAAPPATPSGHGQKE